MSDFTKGLPCPNCDRTAQFQGGSFGSGINTTNIKCNCGFTAFVVLTKDGHEYEVRAEPKDREKANPYKGKDFNKLIIEKHYLEAALKNTSSHLVIDTLHKSISFLNDILKD